jgi:DNA repair exonuclease SbcCD nuclease subunit
MVKIVHTADWQLGKPFGGFPDEVRAALAEARLDMIDRIADAGVQHGAGHVLVAGDVFDNIEPGDRVLVQALSRMGRTALQWWLMPGNHDHARAGGLWSRVRAKAPGNIHVADAAEAMMLEDGAWLLPAPLDHRRTRDDPTEQFDNMATPAGAVRIGLAHGSITEFGRSSEATNLIPPNRARKSGLDYLALGDWHGHLLVNANTAYSGTPEVDRFGRDEPGSIIVADILAGGAPRLERIETGRFRWLTRQWELAQADDLARELHTLNVSCLPAQTLLNLSLTGSLSLGDRVSILRRLEDGLAHEVRWLGLSSEGLLASPTDDDLANIDVQGTLAIAAERLRAQAAAGGPGGLSARSALERLYVEALRVRDEASA